MVVEVQGHRWVDALNQCLKLKTEMVIISSEEENEFVKQLAQVLALPRVEVNKEHSSLCVHGKFQAVLSVLFFVKSV